MSQARSFNAQPPAPAQYVVLPLRKRVLTQPIRIQGLVWLLLMAIACPMFAADPVVQSAPLSPREDAAHPTLFELLSPQRTGIHFVQPIDTTHPLKCLYVGGYASPGIALGDLNGDSLLDVFITGGPVTNRLYLQQAGGQGEPTLRFRDVTVAAGLRFGGNPWSAGVTLVDIDNDSDLDVYVCNYDQPNQLFINNTDVTTGVRFVEAAAQYGLDLVDACFASAFCDFDRDGDLDVLVSAYQYVNPKGRPAIPPVIRQGDRYVVLPEYQKYYAVVTGTDGRPTFTNVGRQDYLLRSNASEAGTDGPIRFTDITHEAGLSDRGVGNSALWWDFDHDGWPDIYVGNDFKVADQLWRNNGDGTFSDVIREVMPHTTWFSMGSEVGDINNDGLLDLLLSDMAGTTHYRSKVTMGEMNVHRDFLRTADPRQYMRNALLINTGTGRFLEAAYMAGLASSDWTWAVKLADFDNDRWLDVFITNGAARMFNHSDRNFTDQQRIGKTQWDLWEDTPPRDEENLAYRNLGDFDFENVSQTWGLHKSGMSYSAAYGDLDNDGDLDLMVGNLSEPVSVYRNTESRQHRVRFKLVGTSSNRSAVGAEIRIQIGEAELVRFVNPSMGFLSCNDPCVHFGLGDSTRIDRVSIIWPSGRRQTLHDLGADRIYTVIEDGHAIAERRRNPGDAGRRLFVPLPRFPALKHVEQEFDDYARQPLLPYAHSQLGPGLAVGDVDGDGDEDFYLGRAKGSRRAVYDNVGFGKLAIKSVLAEVDVEDMGALFLDADRDGDRDLYVVSGSVECEPGDLELRDRLYLNNAEGRFTAAEGALPDVRDSGSVVCASDYDRDGDLDLFVGGRVVPGRYPTAPTSRLLRNESTNGKPRFVDATRLDSTDLESLGMVTAAIWSDANNDRWLDLLVTQEWGPVRYFQNEPAEDGGRTLTDRTSDVGLHLRLGWWNGIAAGDLDGDGDVDYVTTNFGLNTQYKASDQKPELLYYGVFGSNGQPRLLEAKYEKDKCFPRRGLSCSSHAMPFVREKVKTFHNFGLSTLQDIYGEANLAQSLQLSANTLATGIWINLGDVDGSGTPQFQFQSLPRLAQISPAFGVEIGDFDADGLCDLFLAHNFFSPQLETGRMDSGLSLILRGVGIDQNGRPQFEPVWPAGSGIAIPGDAKACSLVDFNRDGWDDLLVTTNNGPLQAFEAKVHPTNELLRVKLVGRPGNLDCVGARVSVQFQDGSGGQVAEVYAGGGYLSQSSTMLTFGCGLRQPIQVRVEWPNGEVSTHRVEPGQRGIGIHMP